MLCGFLFNKVLDFPIESLTHARPWNTCLISNVYKHFLPDYTGAVCGFFFLFSVSQYIVIVSCP